ncbi:MAG: hypothetical protein ACI9LN_003791, partial [Saprospiraceae bacterium]
YTSNKNWKYDSVLYILVVSVEIIFRINLCFG